MKRLTIVLMVALAACLGGQQGAYEEPEPVREGLTLLVKNETGSHIRFYFPYGGTKSVTMERECLVLTASEVSGTSWFKIGVKVTGEPVFYTREISMGTSHGWEISVSPWPDTRQFDAISIRPAERCDQG